MQIIMEVFAQFGHRITDGRLRQIENLSRFGEISLHQNHFKGDQQIEIQALEPH